MRSASYSWAPRRALPALTAAGQLAKGRRRSGFGLQWLKTALRSRGTGALSFGGEEDAISFSEMQSPDGDVLTLVRAAAVLRLGIR